MLILISPTLVRNCMTVYNASNPFFSPHCRIFLQLQLNLIQKVIRLRPRHHNPPRLCPVPSSAMTRYNEQNVRCFYCCKQSSYKIIWFFCKYSNNRTSGWPPKVALGNQRSVQGGWSPAPVLLPVCPVPNHLTVASLLMLMMKTMTTSFLQNKSRGIRPSVFITNSADIFILKAFKHKLLLSQLPSQEAELGVFSHPRTWLDRANLLRSDKLWHKSRFI